MSALEPVILNEIMQLKNQKVGLPPVGFGVTMAEKGDVIQSEGLKFLKSGVLAKLGSAESFPLELSLSLPAGGITTPFGADILSVACSDDTIVLTKNGGTSVFIAKRSNNFVMEEVAFPDSAAFRVRYENGAFFFFPYGSATTVYYSFDDLQTISAVTSTVGNPKAVRFLSATSLVFIPEGSSSGSAVSRHTVDTSGVIYSGTSVSLSGVTYLSDLAVISSGGQTYYIAFRSTAGPMKATTLAGPYSAIVFSPTQLNGVPLSSQALVSSPSTKYGGRAYLIRSGLCYFFVFGVGLVSLDVVSGAVAAVLPLTTATADARIFDFDGHFIAVSSVTDYPRAYTSAFVGLTGTANVSGNAEFAISSQLAVRLPSTSVGQPAAALGFVKYAGFSNYVANLYMRIE